MDRIGHEIVAEKKQIAISSIGGGPKSSVQANQLAGKDLLSLLGTLLSLSASCLPRCRSAHTRMSVVKANMSVDLKPTQKMTDDEVMARTLAEFVFGPTYALILTTYFQKSRLSSWPAMILPRK